MANVIRKLSVGINQPDGVIHYQVGNTIKLNGNFYKVHLIKMQIDEKDRLFDIYIKNDMGVVLWKTIINVPVSVEHNIDFE